MEKSYECSKRQKDVSLEELRDNLAEFAQVRGWEEYHSPRNLLLPLVGEVGELSEIFQWKGEVEKGLPDWKKSFQMFFSILFDWLMCVTLTFAQASLTKIVKNAKKYPIKPTLQRSTSNYK